MLAAKVSSAGDLRDTVNGANCDEGSMDTLGEDVHINQPATDIGVHFTAFPIRIPFAGRGWGT